MERRNIKIIAELMVSNPLPNLMEQCKDELYNKAYMTFEARVSNAGVIFSNVEFVNDITYEMQEDDDIFIFLVEHVVDHEGAIRSTYNEYISEGY